MPTSRIALVEADPLAVDAQAARLGDRVGDLLRGDGAEQAAVLAGAVGDREHGLREQRGGLAGALERLALGLLGGLAAALGLLERALRRRLGQLARDEVVAQVAGRDVDRLADLAEPLDLLEQDRLRHRRGSYRSPT